MTEAEWVGSNNVRSMLDYIRYNFKADHIRARKYRLLACACARRGNGLDDEDLHAIALAESMAEGSVDEVEIRQARQAEIASVARKTLVRSPRHAANDIATAMSMVDPMIPVLLRDVFGNPFRRIALNPAWLTADVISMAHQITISNSFKDMSQLIQALQVAGCDDETILSHDKSEVHVRGCWLLDLALEEIRQLGHS